MSWGALVFHKRILLTHLLRKGNKSTFSYFNFLCILFSTLHSIFIAASILYAC